MDQGVGRKRHVTASGLRTDSFQARVFLPRAVCAPSRKVQVATSFVNVSDGEPRDGSDVGVPTPISLVAVAIAARPVEDRRYV